MGNITYVCTGDISMGTKAALSYANTFMGKFEEDFVYNHPTQPLLWNRYIEDDCFFSSGQGQRTVLMASSSI